MVWGPEALARKAEIYAKRVESRARFTVEQKREIIQRAVLECKGRKVLALELNLAVCTIDRWMSLYRLTPARHYARRGRGARAVEQAPQCPWHLDTRDLTSRLMGDPIQPARLANWHPEPYLHITLPTLENRYVLSNYLRLEVCPPCGEPVAAQSPTGAEGQGIAV